MNSIVCAHQFLVGAVNDTLKCFQCYWKDGDPACVGCVGLAYSAYSCSRFLLGCLAAAQGEI